MNSRPNIVPLVLCAFALSFAAAACIEEGTPKTCTVAGVEHAVGDTFPATDGCNTCSCGADGEVSCTLLACVDTCTYDGVVHQVGERFPSTDGCNTCTCGDGGQVACTEIACVPTTCTHNGVVHQVGDGFPAGDGCNTCECQADGSVTCTRIGCAGTCTYDRQTWIVGDTFPAIDGCNTCTCVAADQLACTDLACETCDAETDWWRQYYGRSVEECAAMTFACLEGIQRFENDCGCGCEQPAECEREIDCFYPECDLSSVAVNCPFSTIDTTRDCSTELACPPDGSHCTYPGQDLGCGICFRPEDGECANDADCLAGNICQPLRCACEPANVCVPGCTADAECGEGAVCGDGARCIVLNCAAAADCPPNFRCDAGGCLRERCTSSETCDGSCVNGQCYSEPGTCSLPVP